MVEDFRPDQRLIAHYFKGTNLDITYAQSLEDARQILDHTTDLVFLDTSLPDASGVDSVVSLRKAGFAGPIVAITPKRNPALRAQLLNTGANEVLSKPMDLSLLQQAAAEFLIAGGCEPEVATMLFSTLSEGSSAELISHFVHDCHRLSDTIADAVEKRDIAAVRQAYREHPGQRRRPRVHTDRSRRAGRAEGDRRDERPRRGHDRDTGGRQRLQARRDPRATRLSLTPDPVIHASTR